MPADPIPQNFDQQEGGTFEPHPAGPFHGRLVDVIDLGHAVVRYQNNPPKVSQKCVLAFASGELGTEGQLLVVTQEYTVSASDKATIRKHLGDWRGKPYTDEELLANGYPFEKLVGQPVLFTAIHKQSQKGRTYARIASLSPPMKGVPVPLVTGYTRSEYWAKKKEANRLEVEAHVAKSAPTKRGYDEVPESIEGDDASDLPFSEER